MDFYERGLTKAGIRRVSLARNPAGVIDPQPELKLTDECWPQILREPHKEFCFSSYCVRANNEGRTLETRQLSIFRIMYHIGDIGELSADARPMRRACRASVKCRSRIGRRTTDASGVSSVGQVSVAHRPTHDRCVGRVERRSSVGRASADARPILADARPTLVERRPTSVEGRPTLDRCTTDARPTHRSCVGRQLTDATYDTWSYFSRGAPSPCSSSSWQPNANFYQPHTDLDVNTVNSL